MGDKAGRGSGAAPTRGTPMLAGPSSDDVDAGGATT